MYKTDSGRSVRVRNTDCCHFQKNSPPHRLVRVRTPVVGRLGSGVRVSASFLTELTDPQHQRQHSLITCRTVCDVRALAADSKLLVELQSLKARFNSTQLDVELSTRSQREQLSPINEHSDPVDSVCRS